MAIRAKRLPLFGVRVLVGRARHQASALSGELRRLGATVLEIPFIEIRKPRSFQPLDTALRNLQEFDWLILTSVNGVEAMWDRLAKLKVPTGGLNHLHVAAIGPATREAIEQRGVTVDVVPKEYVAEAVVRSLRRRVRGKRVLLVRAKVARDVIPRELRKAGAHVDVLEAYETVVPQSSRTRLRRVLRSPQERPHFVTFTSSSTARNFVALLGGARSAAQALQARGQGPSLSKGRLRPNVRRKLAGARLHLEGIRLASIGPVTSSTLRELGLRVDIQAREYTIPGLVEAIVRHAAQRSQ
jgi:uroporphyrinogen-III synthase